MWRRVDSDEPLKPITEGVDADGRRLIATVPGTYECSAENVIGVARARRTVQFDCQLIGERVHFHMSLHLLDPPTILSPLLDQHLWANASAQFHCRVDARPRALVDWYHNDRPISALLLSASEERKRWRVEGDR